MRKYNIHNLVKIVLDEGLENSNLINEFLDIFTDNNAYNNKNLFKISIIKTNSFNISNHREYFDKIYIGINSIIDLRYGIEVILNENEIILKTKYRFIEWLMVSLQIGLLKNDCVLIHGAAVAKNDGATLFPSWGGVGKTAIINELVKKFDYGLIGDDFFILESNGTVYNFPKPMVLYPYHKDLFPEVFNKFPDKIFNIISTKQTSGMTPLIKKILSPCPKILNFLRNHNPNLKWILPLEVFGNNITQKSHVKNIFWIERSTEKTTIINNNQNIISQIFGSTINEFDQRVIYCLNILMGIGQLFIDEYIIKWNIVLKNGLVNIPKGTININNNVSITRIGSVIEKIIRDGN